jgi:hypothetical protein
MHPPFEVFSLQYSKWYTTGPTAGVGDIFYFAVSPDSVSIAYSRQASNNDKTVDVFVMPLEGGRSERLVNSNAQALVRFWLTVGGEE